MLLFVATALFSTSCDEVSDLADDILSSTDGAIEYTGAITVSSDDTQTYYDANVSFELEAEDNVISIMMNGVKFDSNMPYAMDIKISDITAVQGIFSTTSVVPTIDDEPYESYTLSSVAGVYTTSTLTLNFTCGDYDVTYVGLAD